MTSLKPRHGLAICVLIAALAAVPGNLLATLTAPDDGATYGLDQERSRLNEVRELLVRRQALQRALEQRVDSLDHEIDALKLKSEETSAILRSGREQALVLERRLDHVIPRLLARSAAVRDRREQTARMLTDLARTSRQVELDPTIRARMLAISPLMLGRLHDAAARLASLSRDPDRMIAQHAEIDRQAPALIAEGERLEQQRQQDQRQRLATVDRLKQLKDEVRRLDGEQRLLADRLLEIEAADAVRAEPKADQPALRAAAALTPAADPVPPATVKGVAVARTEPAATADAVQPSAPQLLALVVREPSEPAPAAQAELAALAPPPAKPFNAMVSGDAAVAVPGSSSQSPGATPLDVVFQQPGPLAGLESQAAPARLPRLSAPIMPIPGAVLNPSDVKGDEGNRSGVTIDAKGEDGDRPGIVIAAAPGQTVAAPEDGRVVFAAPFKSYGLLLIIEHDPEYHTLLWGFSRLEVELGDRVRTGQIVGVMGADGDRSPQLHVELRVNGQPVNPLPWLAASSSRVRG
jgi:murein hydrolase activator